MTTLYLSRLALHLRQRCVQRDLADCYAMHQRILSGFPSLPEAEHAREQFGVLYRVDDTRAGPVVLVQSRIAPDWSRLPDDYLLQPAQMKPMGALYEALRAGTALAFRLRANTVKRISDRKPGQDDRLRGKRVELRGDEALLAWLNRKSQEYGFRLMTVRVQAGLNEAPLIQQGVATTEAHEVHDVRVGAASTIRGVRHEAVAGKRQLTFGGATFDGQLIVTDVQAFQRALEQGIGPAKAFGFGLLSVAPVPTSA